MPIKPLFVIPTEKTWPEDLWGVKLGRQVSEWRTLKDTLPLYVVQALNERDFVWNVDEYEFRTLVIALKTYGELKGNLMVPRSFRFLASD